MKHITLSISEDLLARANDYAKRNDTSLDEMITDFLKDAITEDNKSLIEDVERFSDILGVDTRKLGKREDLYDR